MSRENPYGQAAHDLVVRYAQAINRRVSINIRIARLQALAIEATADVDVATTELVAAVGSTANPPHYVVGNLGIIVESSTVRTFTVYGNIEATVQAEESEAVLHIADESTLPERAVRVTARPRRGST